VIVRSFSCHSVNRVCKHCAKTPDEIGNQPNGRLNVCLEAPEAPCSIGPRDQIHDLGTHFRRSQQQILCLLDHQHGTIAPADVARSLDSLKQPFVPGSVTLRDFVGAHHRVPSTMGNRSQSSRLFGPHCCSQALRCLRHPN
jgi:hypothetical protein